MPREKRSKIVNVTLPQALAERVDRVRRSRAVGAALPALAAVIVAATEIGLDALEAAQVAKPKEISA
jgi:hypothetical protein